MQRKELVGRTFRYTEQNRIYVVVTRGCPYEKVVYIQVVNLRFLVESYFETRANVSTVYRYL